MEMQHTWLEAVLTVASITSITSVGLLWFFRKKDQQKLAAELHLRREQSRLHASATEASLAVEELVLGPVAQDRDIRRFVARRAPEWTAATHR